MVVTSRHGGFWSGVVDGSIKHGGSATSAGEGCQWVAESGLYLGEEGVRYPRQKEGASSWERRDRGSAPVSWNDSQALCKEVWKFTSHGGKSVSHGGC